MHTYVTLQTAQKNHVFAYTHTLWHRLAHKHTYKHQFILLLLSQGMALSSYSTPMGKCWELERIGGGERQTDRQKKDRQEGKGDRRLSRVNILPSVCEFVCWCICLPVQQTVLSVQFVCCQVSLWHFAAHFLRFTLPD